MWTRRTHRLFLKLWFSYRICIGRKRYKVQSTRLTLRNQTNIIRKSWSMQNSVYSITVARMHRLLIHRQTRDSQTDLIGWLQGWFLAETLSARLAYFKVATGSSDVRVQASRKFCARINRQAIEIIQRFSCQWNCHWIIIKLNRMSLVNEGKEMKSRI